MPTPSYQKRRGQLETYFDRTAVDAWKKLTSDTPVGRVRATVRAGREEMRQNLLDWLPDDLSGKWLLDAGCGTGMLSVAAAQRGAQVVAIDLAGNLVDMARERAEAEDLGEGRIDFRVGDFLNPELGEFDYVVAMDSFIHYKAHDIVGVLAGLTSRTHAAILFTFAPRTPALSVMHAVGKLFPKSDRSPAIEPVAEKKLLRLIGEEPSLDEWRAERTRRISRGFYTSQALELKRGSSA
ncbi:magnesium protoporphyrin IX methyltransferase [Ectothiorhodospira sp. BSL-9]|uniref:magnesium protoporphyrin IX methyltransferase n=1 Tax=Ectothiorhodospira sp. BSL-9 TaxID=1442136 RepID=UPI0007B42F3B|nr:magnesium protoporphyrin IX methyltransferase [Ectothiorhodospira sp. BSL-9]ANB03347.1 SAM-dependent methyltransferase [Ectothiorhodospira sp. BSL-9]TVQ74774.1 MAG: magnesium protoporphyrin IX methyltransferase [Chromatiaceae bacterium]